MKRVITHIAEVLMSLNTVYNKSFDMGNVMAELFKLQEPTKFSDMPEIDLIVCQLLSVKQQPICKKFGRDMSAQHYTYSILTINNSKKQKDRSRLSNDISLWAQ